MSLIKCPECSHEMSDKAYWCPKCGYSRMGEQCKRLGERCGDQLRALRPTIVARAKQVRVVWTYMALCLATTLICVLNSNLFDHLAISGEQFGLAKLHTLISYSFVHGGVVHWLFNMLALALAGLILEPRIGRLKTSFVLLAGILGTSVAYALLGGVPMIGSTGAVFGFAGGILALWVFHIAALTLAERIIVVLLSIHVLLHLVSGNPTSTEVSIFGFLAGFLVVFYLKKKGRLDLDETSAHDKR